METGGPRPPRPAGALPSTLATARPALNQANDERALSRLLNCTFFAAATEPSS